MSWFVRHRPTGDTSAPAVAVEVTAATRAEAIDQVRATLPEGQIITPVAPY
jgi:hypothetical protein